MTNEQIELLFEPIRRQLEAELAAIDVEARLIWEPMVKESEAHVASAVAAVSASAAAVSASAASTTSGA